MPTRADELISEILGEGTSVSELNSSRSETIIDMVLNEDRMPALHQKWGEKLSTKHDTHMVRKVTGEVTAAGTGESLDQAVRTHAINHIAQHIDPTPNKQYTDKLLQHYHNGQFRLEDTPRIKRAVEGFHQLKTRIKPEHVAHLVNPKTNEPMVKNPKDFSSYSNIGDLEDAVGNARAAGGNTKSMAKAGDHEVVEHGTTLLHKDDKLEVRNIHTKDAMMILGRNTKWCTAAKDEDENMFNHYKKSGDLHFIHDKTDNKKYLMHKGEDQLMNERDEPVDHKALAAKHPKLHDLFHHTETDSGSDMFYDHKRGEKAVMSGTHTSHELYMTASGSKNHKALEHIAQHHAHDPDTAKALLMNQHTPSHVIDHVIRNGSSPHNDDLAATHQNTHGDTLDHIMQKAIDRSDSDPSRYKSSANNIMHSVVKHKNTNGGTLKAAYDAGNGRGAFVRDSAFMDNDHTPHEVIHNIVHNAINNPTDRQSEFIMKGATRHPHTSAEHLTAIHQEHPGLAQQQLVKHPNTPGHVLDSIHKSTGSTFEGDIIQHPNAPSHTLHRIAHAAVQRLHIPVVSAGQTRADTATLNQIRRHPNTGSETQQGIHTHFGALTKNTYQP